jgi:Tol biopolymer transport system component
LIGKWINLSLPSPLNNFQGLDTSMKIRFSLALDCLIVLGLCGCSIDLNQPTLSFPTLSPTTNPDHLMTPSPQTTRVPITWASLNLVGRLIYISADTLDNNASPGIQVLDLATGEVSTIFRAPEGAWIFYVTISPDAKQLVLSYISPSQPGSPSNRAIYIMPLDETERPRLLITPPTPADHYTQAEWSPDGKNIYYAHYNSNDPFDAQLNPAYDIFRMSYPDGKAEKIVDHGFWPRISSDAAQLVYVSIDPVSGKNELYVANIDGSSSIKIALSGAAVPEVIDAPIFSPDGQSILFSAPPPQQAYKPNWFERLMGVDIARAHSIPSDWWSVPVTGGVPTRLTQLQTINLFASISPDKKHVASVSGEGIFMMDLDGSNLTRLLLDPGVYGTVTWIP